MLKMGWAIAALAALVALVGVVPVAAVAEKGFKAETFKLENGMTVIVLPDHRVPVVTQMVWYRVGSADETKGKSGIAHFLEHLMFKGTDDIPPGEFSKRVARLGGQDNAFTSNDYTAYYERIAKDRLDEVMGMEADRMRDLRLTDEIVLPERDVILEERNQSIDNDPQRQMTEQLLAALYLAHPYGIPIIGWRHEMEGLTREDAIAFYGVHYAPDNAILVLAGDVTADEIRPMVEKHFADLKPSGVSLRVRPKEPPQLAARRLAMSDARVQQPQMTRLYLVPSYATAKGSEAHALELACDILGGGETSRLYEALVERQKLATAVSIYYDGDAYDETAIWLSATPREGVPLEKLEAAMDKVIADFIAKGPTAEEMARSKTVLRAAAIFGRDSQFNMARIYGTALTTGQSIEDVEAWPDRIEGATVEEVKAALAAYVKAERSVTGYLTPAAQ
ncbi:MAG: insulinase family protein [Alphaproteobacteria bacterium]|nr:insulinase family protein [Alphaproteobacteria bacterium]